MCPFDGGLRFALSRRVNILIVDDYPGLIELYDFGLAARGFRVDGAATASEAIGLAASRPFDAVVIDLNLPDSSGVDLMRKLRALPSLAGRPIVGISSADPPPTVGGFDAFLRKPLHPKRLASVLRRLLDRERDKEPLTA